MMCHALLKVWPICCRNALPRSMLNVFLHGMLTSRNRMTTSLVASLFLHRACKLQLNRSIFMRKSNSGTCFRIPDSNFTMIAFGLNNSHLEKKKKWLDDENFEAPPLYCYMLVFPSLKFERMSPITIQLASIKRFGYPVT